jgi:hypothetical protein
MRLNRASFHPGMSLEPKWPRRHRPLRVPARAVTPPPPKVEGGWEKSRRGHKSCVPRGTRSRAAPSPGAPKGSTFGVLKAHRPAAGGERRGSAGGREPKVAADCKLLPEQSGSEVLPGGRHTVHSAHRTATDRLPHFRGGGVKSTPAGLHTVHAHTGQRRIDCLTPGVVKCSPEGRHTVRGAPGTDGSNASPPSDCPLPRREARRADHAEPGG